MTGKNVLCKLGFHRFEEVKKISGYIDCGESILRHEETQVICNRNNCRVIKGRKDDRWIKFEKIIGK